MGSWKERTDEKKIQEAQMHQCQEDFSKQADLVSARRQIVKQSGFEGGVKFDDLRRRLFFAKTDSERNPASRDFEQYLTSGGISTAEAHRLAYLVRSAGASTQHLLAQGRSDQALELNRGIGSGKFKSADDIFAQMQKWGYSSFVQQERARLAAYQASDLQAQIENIQQRADITGVQAAQMREFAEQLLKLGLLTDNDTADALKRYSEQLSDYAKQLDGESTRDSERGTRDSGLETEKTDGGTIVAKIKTTLKEANKTLSRVVSDADKEIETVSSGEQKKLQKPGTNLGAVFNKNPKFKPRSEA
ncbi:hypothetical protein HY991_04960 [Candidatus Micrarchaeota archaeon]|nr:hypothetical protein [Candidatus Micrarchaeota archaeon]